MASEALGAEKPGQDCCSSSDSILPLLRGRIDTLYPGPPELPIAEFRDESQHVLHALWQTIRAFEIPQPHFHAWLDGVAAERMKLRYATWTALKRDAEATYGSVALIATCVLGLTRSDARDQVLSLGAALRLTEMLRTLSLSRSSEKISLPLEDFVQAKYRERDFQTGVINDGFRALLRLELSRACALLDQGTSLIPWLGGEGSRVAAAGVLSAARSQLREIERRQDQLLSQVAARPALLTPRNLSDVWRTARAQPDHGTTFPSSPSSEATK
jgi:phytoene synthase